jgi:GT2 family glycosyltransferase
MLYAIRILYLSLFRKKKLAMYELTACKGGYLLANGSGGTIFIDRKLRDLVLHEWEYETRSQHAPNAPPLDPIERAALALLRHALRQPSATEPDLEDRIELDEAEFDLISVIMVGFNSLNWVRISIPELHAQSYPQLEIVFVDNGSEDGSSEWITENYSHIKLCQFTEPQHLSKAINYGVEHAQGTYLLMLNPDVRLTNDAIMRLYERVHEEGEVAAVAAKLRFADATNFLNGIGNRVGPFSWGVDNGLGHLDMGQFDHWRELPSVCFAATLIKRDAWNAVGPLDEGFPLYYEDSEWSYRARALGYKLLAAPQSVIYHDFSPGSASTIMSQLQPGKLRNVVYGRLRFATKLISSGLLWRFLFGYLSEDLCRLLFSFLTLRFSDVIAILSGWNLFLRNLRKIRLQNYSLSRQRVVKDQALFRVRSEIPPVLIRKGRPEFTWDLILRYYIPLELSNSSISVEGLEEANGYLKDTLPLHGLAFEKDPWKYDLSRVWDLLNWEGFYGLLHRFIRQLQWRLSRL